VDAICARGFTVVVRKRRDQEPKKEEREPGMRVSGLSQKGTRNRVSRDKDIDWSLFQECDSSQMERRVLGLGRDKSSGPYLDRAANLAKENEQLKALVSELTIRNQVLTRRLTGLGWSSE
jgi:hypothetical protein